MNERHKSQFVLNNNGQEMLISGYDMVIDLANSKPLPDYQPPVSTGNFGKLTGVQLRAISAADQLQSILHGEMFPHVKDLASATPEELKYILKKLLDENDDDQCLPILATIQAVAMFAYIEVQERGLETPPVPDEDDNDPDDGLSRQ